MESKCFIVFLLNMYLLLLAMFFRISDIYRIRKSEFLAWIAVSDSKRRKTANLEDQTEDKLPLTDSSEMAVDSPLPLALGSQRTKHIESTLPLRPHPDRQISASDTSASSDSLFITAENDTSLVVEGNSWLAPACRHGKAKAKLDDGNK